MTDLYAFRQNAVVAASAGTGKTHALVGIVVHALLGLSEVADGPVLPRGIVATTFSRRAAAEMRERIVRELALVADGIERSRYAADFAAAVRRVGDRAPDARAVRERARLALLTEGDMFVGTLHGWATKLVREHGALLGLPHPVNFIDDHEHLVRTLDVVGKVIDARYPEATRAVSALVAAAGSRANLASDLAHVLRAHEEDAATFGEAIVRETCGELESTVNRVNQLLEAMARDPEFGGYARQAIDELASGGSGALEVLCNLQKWNSGAAKERESFGPRAELIALIRGAGRRKSVGQFVASARRRAEFDACAQEAKTILAESERLVRKLAERDAAWSFGQLMRSAVQLLRETPAAAQTLRESLQILVVDEFQDTSRLQADFIVHAWQEEPLSREPGTIATVAGLRGKGLMLVGDRKQSIYGFRGADVSVFGELAASLAGIHATSALKLPKCHGAPTAHFYALQTNRRSTSRILDVANAFSAQRLQPAAQPQEAFEIAYSPESEDLHLPDAGAEPGRVEWLVAADGNLATERRVRNGEAIAEHIRRMLADAHSELGALRFADFAVLAANRRALDAVAYCLGKAGLPFVMSGTGFYAAQEVRDAVALLRWFEDQTDTLALLEVLRGPWLGLSDEALANLCDDRGLPRSLERLARAAKDSPTERAELVAFVNVLDSLNATATWANPGTFLQVADDLLGLSQVARSMVGGAQKQANIAKLKMQASRFASRSAFLRDFNERAERESVELQASVFSDEDDAVRLLTVHASKGLDFPVVFWTDLTDAPRIVGRRPVVAVERAEGGRSLHLAARLFEPRVGTLNSPVVSKMDEREMRRMLAERQRVDYVALTRAARALVFVGPPGRSNEGTALSVVEKLDPTLVDRVAAEPSMAAAPFEECSPPAPQGTPGLLHAASGGSVVAVTALSDFDLCPRRYELKHEYQLAEPALGRSHRELGAEHHASSVKEGILLHSLLEQLPLELLGSEDAARTALANASLRLAPSLDSGERARAIAAAVRFATSAYVSTIQDRAVRIEREWPFVLPSPSGALIRGALDWLVELKDGSFEILDYKSAATPEIDRYAFQIAVYRAAVAHQFQRPVRAGLMFLGSEHPEPKWVKDDVDFATPLVHIVTCRRKGEFPLSPPANCRAIGCGYLSFCHLTSRMHDS